MKVTWEPDGGVSYFSLKVAVPQSAEEQSRLSFWSEFEPELDFYFIAGDNYDEVISGYRTLTGKASLYPKWSFGFWQSKERYSTQEELVSTLAEMRRREIPVDNIVQSSRTGITGRRTSGAATNSRPPAIRTRKRCWTTCTRCTAAS